MKKTLNTGIVNATKINFENVCLSAEILIKKIVESAISNSDCTVDGIKARLSKIGENIEIASSGQAYNISLIVNYIPDGECDLLIPYTSKISAVVKNKEILSYVQGNSAFKVDGHFVDSDELYELYANNPEKFKASMFCKA